MQTPTTDTARGAGKVVVAYIHPPSDVGAQFHQSMMRLMFHDLTHDQRIIGWLPRAGGAGALARMRNTQTETFHADHYAEWLMWIDADHNFAGDAIDRLLAVADAKTRPVVGGLCFGQTIESVDDNGTPTVSMFPTIYRWHPQSAIFSRWANYPRDEVVRCAGTGGAFILIHRSVVDRLYDKHGPNWYTPIPHPEMGHVSEDLSFCLRLAADDIPVHVHTGVEAPHCKERWLDQRQFDLEAYQVPNFVVIPTKGAGGHIKTLVRQLVDQGEADAVFVLDNGCNVKTRNWLESQPTVEVVDMADAGIHEMWNRGLDLAHQRNTRANVAVLNDDLEISPKFLTRLGKALRSNPALAVVGPNYDRRPVDGVQLVESICAGRYDGTGGLSGFAFMLQTENPYRFPEALTWWGGDNHLVATMITNGHLVGIDTATPVVHVDGGGQTGDWESDDMADVLAADLAKMRELLGDMEQ